MPLSIVEVGAYYYKNLTGCGIESLRQTHSFPRIAIDQPESQLMIPEYKANKKDMFKHAPKGGTRCVEADVYRPIDHKVIPSNSVGLWALADVVNDPGYFGDKDYFTLADNIAGTLGSKGLVVFSTPDPEREVFQTIKHTFSQTFKPILDEQTELTCPLPEIKLHILTACLHDIGLIDEALLSGLKNSAHDSWVIYQKK